MNKKPDQLSNENIPNYLGCTAKVCLVGDNSCVLDESPDMAVVRTTSTVETGLFESSTVNAMVSVSS